MTLTKILVTLLLILATANFAYSCSAIVLKTRNQKMLTKNFDRTYRDGILIKNLRGTNKTAYYTHAGDQAQ